MKVWKSLLPPAIVSAVVGGCHYGCKGFETVHLVDFLLHIDRSTTLGAVVGYLMPPAGVATLLFVIFALVGVVVRLARKHSQSKEAVDLPASQSVSAIEKPRVKTRTMIEEREFLVKEKITRTVIESEVDEDAVVLKS